MRNCFAHHMISIIEICFPASLFRNFCLFEFLLILQTNCFHFHYDLCFEHIITPNASVDWLKQLVCVTLPSFVSLKVKSQFQEAFSNRTSKPTKFTFWRFIFTSLKNGNLEKRKEQTLASLFLSWKQLFWGTQFASEKSFRRNLQHSTCMI